MLKRSLMSMFESRRVKTTIVILGIAVITAVVLSTSPFLFATAPATHAQSSSSVQGSQPIQRGPPSPLPLTLWGKQDSLEHAKSVTGMSWVSLPTLVPQDLTLAPIRVKSDSYVTSISAIYTPLGVTTSDNDTNEEVANAGGFSILYLKQIGAPGANETRQFEKVAQQFPNAISLDIINGHQALIEPNEIQINAGNCMGKTNCSLLIILGSRTLNSTELKPIAESIAILPHN
jgi:hypothetical protein